MRRLTPNSFVPFVQIEYDRGVSEPRYQNETVSLYYAALGRSGFVWHVAQVLRTAGVTAAEVETFIGEAKSGHTSRVIDEWVRVKGGHIPPHVREM